MRHLLINYYSEKPGAQVRTLVGSLGLACGDGAKTGSLTSPMPPKCEKALLQNCCRWQLLH